MTAFTSPIFSPQDPIGRTYPKAKLYFFEPHTTDPKATYIDPALTEEHPHPIIADGAGDFAEIYMKVGGYRVILRDCSNKPLSDSEINQLTKQNYVLMPGARVLDYGTPSPGVAMKGVQISGNGDQIFFGVGAAVVSYNLTPNFVTSNPTLNTSTSLQLPATSIRFENLGSQFFTLNNNDTMDQYAVGDAFDIDTLGFSGFSLDLPEPNNTQGFDFSDDGLTLYVIDSANIYQYDLTTSFSFEDPVTFISSKPLTHNGTQISAHDIVVLPGGLDAYIFCTDPVFSKFIGLINFRDNPDAKIDLVISVERFDYSAAETEHFTFDSDGVFLYLSGDDAGDTAFRLTSTVGV